MRKEGLMVLTEVEGFILSETPYGETSKIINVFTSDYGVIGIMCKGAKSLKSKNRVSTMRLTFAKFNICLLYTSDAADEL